MEKWFERQSRLVQIILLLIPVVNWVIEVGVRWSHALKKGSLLKYHSNFCNFYWFICRMA